MESQWYPTEEIKDAFYTEDPSDKVKGWGNQILNAIKKRKVILGMTREQVRTSWGRPKDIHKNVGSWGVHEQWIYGDTYLYFENDKLTSWQD